MFNLTGGAPEAEKLFARAATLLGGRDPREFVNTEDSNAVHHNYAGQILCCLQPLAAIEALRAVLPKRLIVAGYSVGEVAAWGVAGFLSPMDILDVVSRRARVMDAASPAGDGMLFIRGLSRALIDGLCERYHAEIAIISPADAFVLGGNARELTAVGEEAMKAGASRVVALPVEVASHTARLSGASAEFRTYLKASFPTPTISTGVRLLSGIDGSPVMDGVSGLEKLAAQISQTVRWDACLQGCVEGGATAFLELGPGSALRGMEGEANPNIASRSLDDFRTLDGVRSWIAKHADN